MGISKAWAYNPDELIPRHRRAPEFVAALEAGDRKKAQDILTKIIRDKDGQTAWELTQWYADDTAAFARLRAALS